MAVFLKVLLLISDAQNLPITFNNRFCCLGETSVMLKNRCSVSEPALHERDHEHQ